MIRPQTWVVWPLLFSIGIKVSFSFCTGLILSIALTQGASIPTAEDDKLTLFSCFPGKIRLNASLESSARKLHEISSPIWCLKAKFENVVRYKFWEVLYRWFNKRFVDSLISQIFDLKRHTSLFKVIF